MGQRKVWVKKMFGSKKRLHQKKFMGQKKYGSKKNVGSKIFLGKQIFWLQKFWVKKIRSEKLGRVNIRGRIYGPLPQIILGLKLCWVVVSYAC